MDNYFTSTPFSKYLFQNKLGLIGTLTNNKNEIPDSFLALNDKEINWSLFSFDGTLTLLSYTPKVDQNQRYNSFNLYKWFLLYKAKKTVIFLSTVHHEKDILINFSYAHQNINKKPLLIHDYYKIKD